MKKVYLIAVVFALIAGFATYMFADTIDKKTTIKDADTVSVYVAAQDIPENTEITEDMLATDDDSADPYFVKKDIVVDYATPNYVTEKENLVGYVTLDPIYTGEQVSSSRLISVDDKDVSLSFKLSDGMVAYSFSAGTVNGVDGYISAGDTVDVIVYNSSDDDSKSTSEVAYKNLKILRISSNEENQSADSSGSTITSYSTLTVEVTEKQALQLYQIENEHNFKLVLNPRDKITNNDKTTATADTTDTSDVA
jgi:pilus assembly protein CpaB